MTPAQMTMLVAGLRASADPVVVKALTPATSDMQALMDWCNALASPAVLCWKDVLKSVVFAVADMSEMDNISAAAKRETFWNLMAQQGSLNCSTVSGPKLITDLFPNASASTTRAALLTAAHEPATNAEVIIGAATGGTPWTTGVTSQTPPTAITAKIRPWIGTVSIGELAAGLRT